MPLNVFRQSRCLNTSDSICGLFKRVCDKNDRNDNENEKSCMTRIGRGLRISCHSFHLFDLGMVNILGLRLGYDCKTCSSKSWLSYA